MRILADIFVQTFRTLWAHKVRSFLTMFGIAWGVGSLLLLVGLGEGFRSGNRRQLETIGQDIMFVFGGRIPAVPGSPAAMRPFQLQYKDFLDVKNEATMLRAVAPVIGRADITIQTESMSASGNINGTTVELMGIRKLLLSEGRWLNQMDIDGRRRVAFINDQFRNNMFSGKPALGMTFTLNGVEFIVIGIMRSAEQGGGNPPPNIAFIPITTMRDFFPLKVDNGANAISLINFQPRSRQDHEAAKIEVRKIIARNHGFDYTVEDAWFDWDTIESQEMIGKIFTAMNWFLGGVGVVTLSLGAIGIINIMLVSVTERTSEIGLRKALGATNGSILLQFFLEGITLTLLSGVIGLGLAAALVAGLSYLPQPPGFDTPRIVPWSAMMAISFLATCGVVAGLYPAKRAAMLTPVEALRKE
jgi:putative ABC transport system permease protein